jgi:glycerophosphoryl diester phosphodiesterase
VSAVRLREVKGFADGVAPAKGVVLARPGLVTDAHAVGLSVTVWTFRAGQTGRFPDVRAEMAYFLRELHADALFTDNPGRFPRC